MSTTLRGLSGQECGGQQQWSTTAIPTKPAGGLLSNIGKVALALRWTTAQYWTAHKLFNVPPWASTIHPYGLA